jgi:hypothetical protein
MKDLPAGMADFAAIRQRGGYYADKTKFLYEVAQWPAPFFLSRPRSFGKSLLVSALECLLRGQRKLFKGLWIDSSGYKWTRHPVIRLEMNHAVEDDVATMEDALSFLLAEIATKEKVEIKENRPKLMLLSLVNLLYRESGQKVAILID